MKKISIYSIVVAVVLISVGCQNGGTNNQKKTIEGNTYQGVIPCADCAGIAVKLSLQKGQQFKKTMMYIGASSHKFIETGAWKIKQDTLLVLNDSSNNPRLLDIGDNKLKLLKGNGKPVTGDLADNFVLQKVSSNKKKKIWKEERKKGVDFHAMGNEPSWSLTIDFKKKMIFHSLNGDTVSVAVPSMKVDEQSEARIMKADTEAGALTVALSPVGCVDDMSGWVYDYHVSVNVNGKQYSGCGEFINPDARINEHWTLYSLNGKEITKQDSSFSMPYLQFSVAKQKVFGNTSCNVLNGNFSINDSSITFSKMATTKRACIDQKLEQPFLEALNKVNNFEIANGELILLNQDDTLMVFRKAR